MLASLKVPTDYCGAIGKHNVWEIGFNENPWLPFLNATIYAFGSKGANGFNHVHLGWWGLPKWTTTYACEGLGSN